MASPRASIGPLPSGRAAAGDGEDDGAAPGAHASGWRSRATVRQCAILVGGLGTRLGSLTATLPKPLMPVGDRPFLAWLMREMQRFGVEEFVLLAGHLSDEIERAVDSLHRFLPKPARIHLSVEPHRAGTGGALFHARALLDERFLLCNGDSLFGCNLSTMLARAGREDGAARHWMMLRAVPDTARYGVASLVPDASGSGLAGRIDGFSPGRAAGAPGLINAGIYLLCRDALEGLRPSCSLEADIIPALAASGRLNGVVGEGYFRDIGIPADLALAQDELPRVLHRPALFLDRDGVINRDHGWVGTRDRFDWMPESREGARRATTAGWHVFVVTNQSGIARGFYDEQQLDELHRWMADELRAAGGTLDDLRFCPFHPDAVLDRFRRASDWRKPAPGMILDLLRVWGLDPARCVLIGDQPTDIQAAAAAGVAAHLCGDGQLLSILSGIGIAA
ncbi:HAD-IIIA family hydrolase [Rhizosaccharibacter radicis]|uniref:D,D-heptose 1,7-bisphosphate phosphatase n=1 Tax=Rhizosaccharibacter radicis TaxID=2782605 RepID=A0ABT1VT77_9PROT|nr:HAD-IIIA family hydrolase [Acetobacteraceae bacterium KSS12]